MNLLQAPHPRFLRINAAAIRDANGLAAAPASLLVELELPAVRDGVLTARATVLAAGRPGEVDAHPAAGRAVRLDRPKDLLLPGLVNAHTHLDLTHIGPIPHDPADGFTGFVETVRTRRHTDPAAIAESVRRGAAASLLAGVVAVGDIAGAVRGRASTAALAALAATPLQGTSFLEFFAIGLAEQPSLEWLRAAVPEALALATPRIRAGLQPHAPYSVSPRGYAVAADLAARHGVPLSTHLAETPEEVEFVARGSGPNRAFQERLGLWSDAELADFSAGRRPVEQLAGVLGRAAFIAAHVNYATDDDLATLAATGTVVAYCPRASAYFEADRHFGPHRYRDMLAAGIAVALGTDSVLNLPAPDLSIFEEMRFLRRRDGTAANLLLAMATLHGAKALALDPAGFTFAAGSRLAGLNNTVGLTPGHPDPLERALAGAAPLELLLMGT